MLTCHSATVPKRTLTRFYARLHGLHIVRFESRTPEATVDRTGFTRTAAKITIWERSSRGGARRWRGAWCAEGGQRRGQVTDLCGELGRAVAGRVGLGARGGQA